MASIFEQASRMRLTYETTVGVLGVDDLWTMKLTDLDTLAVSLKKRVETDTVSYLTAPKPDEKLLLRFEIADHIIKTRLAERAEAALVREKAEQKQKILGILARKQDEKLEAASEEELRAMIDNL